MIEGNRAVTAIWRYGQSELPRLRSNIKVSLLVARSDTFELWLDPNLKEMHWLIRGMIELTVSDAGTGAHPLNIAIPQC